jgi:uncharacterized protein YgfB (UPF0149 family)
MKKNPSKTHTIYTHSKRNSQLTYSRSQSGALLPTGRHLEMSGHLFGGSHNWSWEAMDTKWIKANHAACHATIYKTISKNEIYVT